MARRTSFELVVADQLSEGVVVVGERGVPWERIEALELCVLLLNLLLLGFSLQSAGERWWRHCDRKEAASEEAAGVGYRVEGRGLGNAYNFGFLHDFHSTILRFISFWSL